VCRDHSMACAMQQQEILTVVSYGLRDANLKTQLAPTFFGACVCVTGGRSARPVTRSGRE
jgi:hypothetical protein